MKDRICGLSSLFVVGFFLIAFGSAAGSDTETTFGIPGCVFNVGDEDVSVVPGACSGVPYYGNFFCGDNSEEWITSEVNLGCSRGASDISIIENFIPCCPSGQFCNATSGAFQCVLRLNDCSINLSEADCEADDMQGVYYNGKCICSMADQTCGTYVNSADCNDDDMDLAGNFQIMTKSVSCNGTEFVSSDSVCVWDTVGLECRSGNNVTQGVIGVGEIATKFSCFNTYELDACVDGLQNVTWFSNYTLISGNSSDITPELLACVGCDGGERERYCGEPLIKLPGFSLFSLFAAFGIIGLVYFFKR